MRTKSSMSGASFPLGVTSDVGADLDDDHPPSSEADTEHEVVTSNRYKE